MSTGPEDYRKAKALMDTLARTPHPINEAEAAADRAATDRAQVHAILALAAATAEAGGLAYKTSTHRSEWHKALHREEASQ